MEWCDSYTDCTVNEQLDENVFKNTTSTYVVNLGGSSWKTRKYRVNKQSFFPVKTIFQVFLPNSSESLIIN